MDHSPLSINNRDDYFSTKLKNEFISSFPDTVIRTATAASSEEFTYPTDAEKEYYEAQFGIINSFEEVDALGLPPDVNDQSNTPKQTQHERAMKLSNAANIILLVAKVIEITILILIIRNYASTF